MSLISTTTEWQERAACLTINTTIFFPYSTGYHEKPGSTAWDRARAVCKVCTVRMKCLDFAINNRLGDGMYGGKTPEERNAIRNQRRKELKELRLGESA